MLVKFQIALESDTFKALRVLAGSEYRDHRAQAALLISEELRRRGLLGDQSTQAQHSEKQGVKNGTAS